MNCECGDHHERRLIVTAAVSRPLAKSIGAGDKTGSAINQFVMFLLLRTARSLGI